MTIVVPNLGLRLWNKGQDPYNSQQLADNFAKIDQHDHSQGRGRPLGPGALANQSVTANKLADAARLGLTDGSIKRRGVCHVPGTDSRTGTVTAYGTMPTPDIVTGIVLPTDGLIFIAYQATWQESVNAAARAAIFLNTTQLKRAPSIAAGGPAVQEASIGAGTTVNNDFALWTKGHGLSSWDSTGSIGGLTPYTGDVTTGQLVGSDSGGGEILTFATAGTYDISVQFKASSGSVTAKNRKLWVWTAAF